MTAITRRTLGALALSAAFAGFALPSQAADKINVGILSLTSHSPSIIAEAKGYFEAQDLDVEFVSFQAAQPMAVAIASGDVDFGMTAISGGLISLADKGVIKIIGGALQETPEIDGQKILASRAAYDAGMKTPADLKGHTYGITTAGSSFHYMAHKIADKEGFDRSEIHVKPLQKVPAIIASLKSGQIDAWSIVPNIAGALTRGDEVVEIGKISDYIDNYQVTTVFTSTKNATEKKDLVERFLAGLSEGISDYNAALVDKSMSEEDTAAIVEMIHKYVYSDQPLEKADPRIRAGAMRINEGAALSVASVEDQLEWFKSEGLVPDGVTMEKLVDTSFVETR
ncbi:ABC transporter substrate-binding protein [Nitratireductor rhodophyticola]|uniref:ABC transporter substrate-binding protein n=1 Tax=Nitratireductor rhodophyticola TaxID=2854036 RepID=A0ABS7R7L1_9HYPH|nr:ABC transporter substrate-binding protein [Nitratireductor rhodophyticola]MBY8916919.1 ABC transporter substrate-binding protein [Nitratireductor rhodophyticola]MBY8920652.1 ABC transporter substrate-binding protein [Nitratireductor rhodophyticola]MEC9243272.1 ABC transporter substrate-binding protein [Pseudomonadota bacterium]WPZ14668.1 ABC transporter substrate-binding protein [Nitratireductor rhodophyticola]